jgi:hypothetical protein
MDRAGALRPARAGQAEEVGVGRLKHGLAPLAGGTAPGCSAGGRPRASDSRDLKAWLSAAPMAAHMTDPDWRHLPPLSALRAFEAAARLGGFSAAGRARSTSPTRPWPSRC